MILDQTIGSGTAQAGYIGLGCVFSWLSGDSPGGGVVVEGRWSNVLRIVGNGERIEAVGDRRRVEVVGNRKRVEL